MVAPAKGGADVSAREPSATRIRPHSFIDYLRFAMECVSCFIGVLHVFKDNLTFWDGWFSMDFVTVSTDFLIFAVDGLRFKLIFSGFAYFLSFL